MRLARGVGKSGVELCGIIAGHFFKRVKYSKNPSLPDLLKYSKRKTGLLFSAQDIVMQSCSKTKRSILCHLLGHPNSKKSPTGPTERTPKPEYLINRSQLTWSGPGSVGSLGPYHKTFLMDQSDTKTASANIHFMNSSRFKEPSPERSACNISWSKDRLVQVSGSNVFITSHGIKSQVTRISYKLYRIKPILNPSLVIP